MKNQALTPILLPTEDASILFINKDTLYLNNEIVGGVVKDHPNQHLYLCSALPIKEGDWFIQHNESESVLRKAVSYDWFEKNVRQKAKTENYLHDYFAIHKYYPYPMVSKTLQEEMEDKVNGLVGYREKIEFATDPKVWRPSKYGMKGSSATAIDGNTRALACSIDDEVGDYEINFLEEYRERYNNRKIGFKDRFGNSKIFRLREDNQKDNQKGIDFKKISQNIDKALKEETPESLTKWLMDKRGVDVEKYGKPNDHLMQVPLNDYINDKHNQDECIGFIDGFKASQALQSNAEGFSLEDMRMLWDYFIDGHYGLNGEEDEMTFKEYIDNLKSLTKPEEECNGENCYGCKECVKTTSQQPKGEIMIECQIEVPIHAQVVGNNPAPIIKLDSNGSPILIFK